MNNSLCSLNKKTNTCLPTKTVKILGDAFLTKGSNNTNNHTEIITKLSEKFDCSSSKTLQSKELCILKNIKLKGQDEIEDSDLSQSIDKQIITYFKPITNKLDGNYWLNNTEIDSIQYQLQKKFPGYYYSYIHMIDLKMFEPSNTDILEHSDKIFPLTNINFVDEVFEKNNKLTHNGKLKYFGVVCNTDLSSNNGKHWFSIFIDFTKSPINIEYFNSSGYSILNGTYKLERENFSKFFYNIADELTKHNKPAEFKQITEIEHQRQDTANCGSYSIFYIWSRLNRIPTEFFKTNKILDEDMEKFRSVMWRKE